ncbi:uncharacterized protein LOC108674177 [Hyalella azteca]|uniref:Uncharacterized protein LOC108674177 n=1 Tax=Hyalella azteca TaxID=294128 RepID=A0A8B7NV21_HYAAZ|nr:uncharacterized protein LOC108674177 [Hyalella azteca]
MTLCNLCNKKPSCYTCPRCNVRYCSSSCYSGAKHSSCSEDFYKEQVHLQLHNHQAPPDSRKRMIEMLKRLESPDAFAPTPSQLLNPEQQSFEQDENEQLDSDDDEDLETRLQGIDLDDSDAVWEQLTEDERRQFCQLIQSGDINEILPTYIPWWLPPESVADNGPIIVELQDTEAKIIKENQFSTSTDYQRLMKSSENKSNIPSSTKTFDNSNLSFNKQPSKDEESTTESPDQDSFSQSPSHMSSSTSLPTQPALTSVSNSIVSDITKEDKEFATKDETSIIDSLNEKISISCSSSSKSKVVKKLTSKHHVGVVCAFSCVPASIKAKYPNCPPLGKVKKLSDLISTTPSPRLRYSVLNTAVGYAWLMRLFNGDLEDCSQEAAEGLLCMCSPLSSPQVFCSAEEAVASVNMRSLQHDWLCATKEMMDSAAADAAVIITGPRELPGYFLIAALCHLKQLLQDALKGKATPKAGAFLSSIPGGQATIKPVLATTQNLKTAVRKLDFYLAYAAVHKQDFLLGSFG